MILESLFRMALRFSLVPFFYLADDLLISDLPVGKLLLIVPPPLPCPVPSLLILAYWFFEALEARDLFVFILLALVIIDWENSLCRS